MIKLEDLKDRLKIIEDQLNHTRANYNALEGSKQELLFWIGKIELTNNDNS
jgi:prefoldin subunit 5